MDGDPSDEVRSAQTQRVRVGMIGLACVFLLVMLVTALLSLGGSMPGGDNLAQRATANESAPREPLAELGVAPGADGDGVAPAPTPPPPTRRR